MSDADVETVRAALEAFNSPERERAIEMLDPDVELIPVRAVFEGTEYRGHEGFRRFVADMADDWEGYRPEPDELRDLGDGNVLVLGRFTARGRASAVEVETPAAWVCSVRERKIARVRFFADEQAALRACGHG